MASNRTIKKPTRSEFLLKGISARYQNYSLERIKDLYKDDDLFKNEKDLTAEQEDYMLESQLEQMREARK